MSKVVTFSAFIIEVIMWETIFALGLENLKLIFLKKSPVMMKYMTYIKSFQVITMINIKRKKN